MAEKEKVVPPGVKERVEHIMIACDNELASLLDSIEAAVKAGKIEPGQREAIKKSLTVYIDCADSVLQEYR